MSPRIPVADARRRQVMRAALECLVDDGYGNLNMRNIARRAGVSTGVLYHYFRNKADILIQSLAAAFLDTDRELRRTVERARDSGAQLPVYLGLAATVGKQDPATTSVLLNGLGQVGYSPAITGRLARLLADFRSYAREVVQDAPETAGRAPGRQDALSAIIVAVGLGLMVQWVVEPGSVDLEACGEELGRLAAGAAGRPGGSTQGGPEHV